jgi:hypothetical protein
VSFDHKAFSFDWSSFQNELAPILTRALSAEEAAAVAAFVDSHLDSCSSPYDGEPLDTRWQETLENGDIQEVADFALTKYYDPSADHGLNGSWADVESSMAPLARAALLGSPFVAAAGALFDPGRMGSYFQSPEQVCASLETLRKLASPELSAFVEFLAVVVADSQGLYVTF